MEDLIKITVKDGKSLVSARDLYEYLEVKERFSRFIERSFEYGFSIDVDYTPYQSVHPSNNQVIEDYALTLDCAKHISMIQRSERGTQAREFFIARDKQLSDIQKYRLPISYSEALRELADVSERTEKLSKELEQAKPKIEFFDQVTDSKDAIDIGSASKVLDLGIGRNTLFDFLRKHKVLMLNNQPYQIYVDKGWFRVVEANYTKPDGSTHINIKTLVYQLGMDGIMRLYKKMSLVKV